MTDNLFGDILTDLGAAIAGGIGLAASGNINPTGTAPSMFEPVHGSAPDIAGQVQGRPDRGDPVGGDAPALTWATPAAAAKIEQAVADDIIERQASVAGAHTVRGRRRHRRPSSRIAAHIRHMLDTA